MFDENDYGDSNYDDQYVLQKLDAFMDCAQSYYHNRSNANLKIQDALKLNILMLSFTDDDLLDIFALFNASIPTFDKIYAHQLGFEEYATAYNLPKDIIFCYSTLFDEITSRMVSNIDELSERISIDSEDSTYMLSEDHIYKSNIINIIENLDQDSLQYLHFITDDILNNCELSPETTKIYHMTQGFIEDTIDHYTDRTPSYTPPNSLMR